MPLTLHPIPADAFEQVWPIWKAVAEAGETYPYPPDATLEDGRRYWCGPGSETFACKENTAIIGTYYLRPNQPGLGDHIANAGFMVAPQARGKGAGKFMLEDAVARARAQGYQAMQFNYVVETNTASIAMCQALGFRIMATIPDAFRHRRKGLVGAHIMHKQL